MALDPRFIVTSDLESYFVDKDSGAPLAGGTVEFFRQDNQSVHKPVYQISVNTNGVYSYTALPNPCTLSDVGTFQDAIGNNIVPYYFPFTGTPSSSTAMQDLYYVKVYSSGGILQFTRNGWPNAAAADGNSATNGDINYIPNGQFLVHNDIVSATEPPIVSVGYGTGITLNSQQIAQGGWSFRLSTTSTSVFTNSFVALPGSIAGLSDTPQFAFNLDCTSYVGATTPVADLTVSWPDVNKFSTVITAQTPSLQPYTFTFAANSGDTVTYSYDVYVIYNFGTGGTPSAPITTLLGTISVVNGWTYYSFNIAGFNANAGILGTDSNSSISLAIRVKSSCNSIFTDFSLLMGSDRPLSFPVATDATVLSESIAGTMPVPAANGSDLYLPLVLTPSGSVFDHSSIGNIEGKMNYTAVTGNLLYCDGSAYLSTDYSALGIPYSRLKTVLFNTVNNGPLFGTGVNFANANISTSATSQLILTTNKSGSQSNVADAGTGFTINASVNAGTAGLGYNAFANSLAVVSAISTAVGTVTLPPSAGTSTFSVQTNVKEVGEALTKYAFILVPVSAAALTTGGTGLYFDFSSTSTNYRMWFHITAEVAPAAGGRTLIQCNLSSTMSVYDVALVISQVISGHQTNTVTATGVPTGGTYFTFNANGLTYYVWYYVNGVGTAPAFPAVQLVKVTLAGGESVAQVAFKTQTAINSQYFAVPDLRGYFLRGNDTTATVDADLNLRYGYYANTSTIGTYQIDQYTQHNHTLNTTQSTAGPGGADDTFLGNRAVGNAYNTAINAAGGSETRPVNASVNYYIRY